jgi:hypothetical protein
MARNHVLQQPDTRIDEQKNGFQLIGQYLKMLL